MTSDRTELTLDEKRAFYRDGFITIKDAVSRDLTYQARRIVNKYAGIKGVRRMRNEIAESPEISNLVNKSLLGELLRNTMGPYDLPTRGFPAILYPKDPSEEIGIHGLPDEQLPNFGWNPHLDGLWTGPIPTSKSEVDDWVSPRTEHFGDGSASVIGANRTPLFQDPECRLSIGSFTAFVGVALNDQTEFGRGNLCLCRGAHEKVEAFFRMQRDKGGPVGPEGPGWPRLVPVGEDSVGLNYFPDAIRNTLTEGAEYTSDGTLWPKPTPVLLDEGDAVIALHAVPHAGTRNGAADPRMNVYFRLRRQRPGAARVAGDSDHPDRGWEGEFYDYPRGARRLSDVDRRAVRPLERVGRHARHRG